MSAVQATLFPPVSPDLQRTEINAFLSRCEAAIKAGGGPNLPCLPHTDLVFSRTARRRGLLWDLPPDGTQRVVRWCEIRRNGRLGQVRKGWTIGEYPTYSGYPWCDSDFWFWEVR